MRFQISSNRIHDGWLASSRTSLRSSSTNSNNNDDCQKGTKNGQQENSNQQVVGAEQLKKTQEPNKRNRQNQKTIFTPKMSQENWKQRNQKPQELENELIWKHEHTSRVSNLFVAALTNFWIGRRRTEISFLSTISSSSRTKTYGRA